MLRPIPVSLALLIMLGDADGRTCCPAVRAMLLCYHPILLPGLLAMLFHARQSLISCSLIACPLSRYPSLSSLKMTSKHQSCAVSDSTTSGSCTSLSNRWCRCCAVHRVVGPGRREIIEQTISSIGCSRGRVVRR
ncbi:hypothetical protein BDZ90DRAFT_3795 [Jaminaea rosea]|uniref:Secreted protein n=1 Tax=Jaminaea rosea TaxID=1569628 RepID=A0A316UXM4_9BASI|nr:hypothetical protein BDZ90DRAFT_3795 [Jaminaea rosea]PWN30060.1 hypothetical protein BDZ90DRAFT_3795 [Jaminaea rosea]